MSSLGAALKAAVLSGQMLNCLPSVPRGRPIHKATMRGWNAQREIDGAVLYELLSGQSFASDETPHSSGIRVRGARIIGGINVQHMRTEMPLALEDCHIVGSIAAYGARLPYLELQGCLVENEIEESFDLQGVEIEDDLRIKSCCVLDRSGLGAVFLTGAKIGADFDMQDSVIETAAEAVAADRAVLSGGANFRELRVSSRSGDSAIRMLGARVKGGLVFNGAKISNPRGSALIADRMEVAGSVFFLNNFRAYGSAEQGVVRLSGVQFGGQLGFAGSSIRNERGTALQLSRANIGESLLMQKGLYVEGAGRHGSVELGGIRVKGSLAIGDCAIVNESGPALSCPSAHVTAFTMRGARLAASSIGPAVDLTRIRVDRQCNVYDSIVVNRKGRAIAAEAAEVADSLTVGSLAYLSGAGSNATLDLMGARVGTFVNLRGATLRNVNGPAVDLEAARVAGSLFLDGVDFQGVGSRPVVDLTLAKVGSLAIDEENVQKLHGSGPTWSFDSCTYAGMPEPRNCTLWLDLLRKATPAYSPSSYQQLSAGFRSAGHDSDVRRILIAQREDQLARGLLPRSERAWVRTTGVFLGYGWKPWKALYFLVGILAVSVVLCLTLGSFGALTHPTTPGRPTESCSVVEKIGVGLDLGTPILSSSASRVRDRCVINGDASSVTGNVVLVSTWVFQGAAWALAALFIAGFTGLVRKT